MMTLLCLPGDAQTPTHSPFCLKAMCLLEMAGQDWKPEYVLDLSTLPMGRAPVLRVEGELIPDSAHIQEYLEQRGTDFNPGLNDAQRALSHALIRMTEESLRMGLVHDRWLDPRVWQITREMFFESVPTPMREHVAKNAQELVATGLMSHGIAQFSASDRLRRLEKDIEVVDQMIGEDPFLFGDTPTAADAAIAPVLDMILHLPVETDLRAAVSARPKIAPYVERVRRAIYPTMPSIAHAPAA